MQFSSKGQELIHHGLSPYSLLGRVTYCLLVCVSLISASAMAETDLTEIPLEDLLNTEVVTASKIAQQVSDAPSAVSIVTAKDIRAYGYRTLAEIINSMRGLNTVSDHVYTYMSGRGFGRPGDYPGRVMLLIDGHQANDNLYNSSYLGNDGLLDTELIDRVEYVSGPGSVSYGNGAFYGIINVITKKGGDFNSAQVAVDAGSHQSYKERATYGKRFDNGADVLFSASTYKSQGQNLFFPEFNSPSTNFGVAKNLDEENNRRLFFKGSFQQWSLETAYVTRKKDDPAASYNADFNVRPSDMQDTNAYINLKYEDDLSETLKASVRTYYGHYAYTGRATYGGVPYLENDLGRWWGSEAKFVYTGFDQHRIVYGLEYRNDYQQDFYLPTAHLQHSSYMASTYLQDEYRLNQQLAFNFGARADYGGNNASNISPRLAAIYSPTESFDIKASFATAFRRPNAYEKYYNDYATHFPSPDLQKERVAASELVFEYRPDRTSKIMSSLYHYTTKNVIETGGSLSTPGIEQFFNESNHKTHGVDFEYEKQWNTSSRLRASYAWQLAKHEEGTWIGNSPKHLAKLNFTQGLFNQNLQAGLETQYVGARATEQGDVLGGYVVTNLTLNSRSLIPNSMLSFSIKNLFDKHYSVPSPDFYMPRSFAQDGRIYWLQFTYDFPQ